MVSCHTHADCFFRRVWHLAIPTQIASLGGYGILPYPRRLRFKGAWVWQDAIPSYFNSCFRNFAV